METAFQKLLHFDQNVLAGLLLLAFYTLESVGSRSLTRSPRTSHLLASVGLQVGYLAVNAACAVAVVAGFQGIEQHHLGLLNQWVLPYPVKLGVGLLGFDFTFYWAHRWYHVSPLLWRLHRVHHSDTHLDSASAFRFHPLDAVLDSTMTLVAAAVFGLDFDNVLCYFLLFLPLLFAQHSALVFPAWTDALLGKVLVSPNLHKVHHHQKQEFTNSNYGFLFSFWDRLFGTFRQLPVDQINYGLAEFDAPDKQRLGYLLKSPFIQVKRLL